MAHDGVCKSDHYRLSPRGSDGSARAADSDRGGVLCVDIGGEMGCSGEKECSVNTLVKNSSRVFPPLVI